MLKLHQGHSKLPNNDNVLQINPKANLSLDKLQTTFSSPSPVTQLFLPADIHPALAKWNPISGLTHKHNPRAGSDLRSYRLLRGYLQMQDFFLHSGNCTWGGKERRFLAAIFPYRIYENDGGRGLH